MPTVKEAIKHLKTFYKSKDVIAYDIWQTTDVIDTAERQGVLLSEEEAGEILENIHRHQDATMGISWDTVDSAVDDWKREHPNFTPYKE